MWFPKLNYLSDGQFTAGEAATADGPPKEPHIPSDPGIAGCSRPDRHAEDWEDWPGVPTGEYTGKLFFPFQVIWDSLHTQRVLFAVNVTRVKDVGNLHIFSREEMHWILMEGKFIFSSCISNCFPLWMSLFFPSGCILSWKGKNGGDHLPADQTYWFPSGQDGPTHKEKKGERKIPKQLIVNL